MVRNTRITNCALRLRKCTALRAQQKFQPRHDKTNNSRWLLSWLRTRVANIWGGGVMCASLSLNKKEIQVDTHSAHNVLQHRQIGADDHYHCDCYLTQ